MDRIEEPGILRADDPTAAVELTTEISEPIPEHQPSPTARPSPRVASRRLPYRSLLLVLLALGLLLRLQHLYDPFMRPHEDDNARYGLAARNHLRLGIETTRFTNCLAVAGLPPEPGDHYPNHPATLSLILAGAYAVLGETVATTRLVPITASLIGMLLLARAVRRRWGDTIALVAAAFLAVTPAAVYYGRLAVFLPLLLPIGVLLCDEYGRAESEPTRFSSARLMLWTVAAVLVDWAGLLLIPALLIAYGPRRRIVPLVVAAFSVASLHLLIITSALGASGITNLVAQGLYRAGITGTLAAGQQLTSFSNLALIRILAFDYLPYLFTPVGIIAALAGLPILTRAGGEKARFVAALGSWGLLYIAVFREAALVHDYWVYYLLPAVAVLYAILVCGLATRIVPQARWIGPTLALLLCVVTSDQSLRILERRYWNDAHWYDKEWAAVAFARDVGAEPHDVILTRAPLTSLVAAHAADRRFIHYPEIPDTFVLKTSAASRTMEP